MRGLGKIFAFTFARHTETRGYRAGTIAGVLICLLVPALIMVATEHFGNSTAAAVRTTQIAEVFVVDESISGAADLNFLNTLGGEGFNSVKYTVSNDLEEALARVTPMCLVTVISEDDGRYFVSVLRPDGTNLTQDDADAFAAFLESTFRYILMQKSGLDPVSIAALMQPITFEVTSASIENTLDSEASMKSGTEHVFSMIIGYILVMVIYFMVLLYGQGVATAVIMEKNSKLMELFLLSVDPGAMVTGKVLAVSLAGAIQFISWALSLICSFAAGAFIVKAINPATDMILIKLFEEIGSLSGMFSVAGIVVALLILLSGFLLYCALSAIGGALAGKPEDLSSTNAFFTLVLVASFFVVVFSGGLTGGIAELNPALLWIPFTGVLSAPSHLILGELSILAGLGIFAVIVAVSLLIMIIAGKLYIAMVHHRGNPPGLQDAFKMLKMN